jgi:hypothetical protein
MKAGGFAVDVKEDRHTLATCKKGDRIKCTTFFVFALWQYNYVTTLCLCLSSFCSVAVAQLLLMLDLYCVAMFCSFLFPPFLLVFFVFL